MTVALAEHWRQAWRPIGEAPEAVFQALMKAYLEPQRSYHTRRHLEHCFAEFEAGRHLALRPSEVALALFFHDAVYDPREVAPRANERHSASWATDVLTAAGAPAATVERVDGLIMATCHDAEPDDGDPALVVDIDLAILGQPAARFDAYEDEVRAEYSWVPEDAFRSGRGRIIRQFLARPRLYRTGYFHDLYDGPARENLRRSLARLT